MTRVLFAFLLLSISLSSCGQPNTDKGKAKLNASCDRFMQSFKEGKFSEAVQSLRQISVLDHETIDTLDKTVNEQMQGVIAAYKNIVGYELIEDRLIKNSIARRRYLLKFEKYFLTFNFILYNNGSAWTITNFNYKDEFQELF